MLLISQPNIFNRSIHAPQKWRIFSKICWNLFCMNAYLDLTFDMRLLTFRISTDFLDPGWEKPVLNITNCKSFSLHEQFLTVHLKVKLVLHLEEGDGGGGAIAAYFADVRFKRKDFCCHQKVKSKSAARLKPKQGQGFVIIATSPQSISRLISMKT